MATGGGYDRHTTYRRIQESPETEEQAMNIERTIAAALMTDAWTKSMRTILYISFKLEDTESC